nr:hypothetical protein [Tanacetum cinerariifolium]
MTEREKQKKASKAALAELYNEIQLQIDADHELATRLTYEEQEKYTVEERLTYEEQEKYTVEERSKLLAEFFERRKKQLAKEKAEAIRMLKVLDRQDVLDLYKIVMERFLANDPEDYDLILWGDLKTLMESCEDDEI